MKSQIFTRRARQMADPSFISRCSCWRAMGPPSTVRGTCWRATGLTSNPWCFCWRARGPPSTPWCTCWRVTGLQSTPHAPAGEPRALPLILGASAGQRRALPPLLVLLLESDRTSLHSSCSCWRATGPPSSPRCAAGERQKLGLLRVFGTPSSMVLL